MSSMLLRRLLPILVAALGGCASPGGGGHPDLQRRDGAGNGLFDFSLGGSDGGTGKDLLPVADQTTALGDLAGADLTAPPNADLTALPDLQAPADLAGSDTARPPPDLTALPDLSSLPDLVVVPDLTPPPPDMTGTATCTPQTTPCDWVCQNCPNGLKCGIGTTGAPLCQTNGSVPSGSFGCGGSNVDDCVAGDVCIGLSTTIPLNGCWHFCRTDGDCKNGGKCAWGLNGSTARLCSDRINGCDPVAQLGCPPASGVACYPVTPTGVDTGCHRTGTGATLAACDTEYDCAAGYSCDVGAGFCRKLCHAGNNGECASDFFPNCRSVNGWSNFGMCSF